MGEHIMGDEWELTGVNMDGYFVWVHKQHGWMNLYDAARDVLIELV